jgi:hypothetical protein
VSDAWTLAFSRKTNDQTLDTVLRVLHTTACLVKGVECERATLLEVLEHYEQTEQENEKQEENPANESPALSSPRLGLRCARLAP